MSAAPKSTRSFGSRLAAIWADINYGQERLIALNRVPVQTGRRRSS